ncbi:hypothetical protein ACKS0A_09469 [Histoplasma ohiense]
MPLLPGPSFLSLSLFPTCLCTVHVPPPSILCREYIFVFRWTFSPLGFGCRSYIVGQLFSSFIRASEIS